jgi:hypothetical protein
MPVNVVIINPYELGRQPFGIAHPAAWLRADGHQVACIDLAQGRLDDAPIADAQLIAIQLAMHTATRIAAEALPKLRALAPNAHVCVYGLYGPVNEAWLKARGITTVLGGEFEEELRALAGRIAAEKDSKSKTDSLVSAPHQAGNRVEFRVPDRTDLAPLERHSRLRLADGTEKTMGFVDATRGCKHVCRHCPVVPVYQGRFRAVPVDIVLADIDQQVAAGAQHISFGDPDFFNGPTHAERILRAMHERHPHLTFDAVIKIEHLLAEKSRLPLLKETGCEFIISAVESVDDTILEHLAKGHTREDFVATVALMREHGVGLTPTFLAFTPWTTLEGYLDLLGMLVTLNLIDNVPAIQLAIRLLIPSGSYLLKLEGFNDLIEPFNPDALGYPWTHRDPRVDSLQQAVMRAAERADTEGQTRFEAFGDIWQLAHDALNLEAPVLLRQMDVTPSQHTENWYCCAEPTTAQIEAL